jgi:hypothetical protein
LILFILINYYHFDLILILTLLFSKFEFYYNKRSFLNKLFHSFKEGQKKILRHFKTEDFPFNLFNLICRMNTKMNWWGYQTIEFMVVRTNSSGTHNNKIHTIYKQTSVLFLIFPCCCFGFISKAATTKNLQFVYDLSICYAWALMIVQI